MNKIKYLLLLVLVSSCSDYPASEGNDSEANPININISIDNDNLLNDPPDNDTQNVDSDNNTSNSDSNSNSTIDNSTGITVYEFYSI